MASSQDAAVAHGVPFEPAQRTAQHAARMFLPTTAAQSTHDAPRRPCLPWGEARPQSTGGSGCRGAAAPPRRPPAGCAPPLAGRATHGPPLSGRPARPPPRQPLPPRRCRKPPPRPPPPAPPHAPPPQAVGYRLPRLLRAALPRLPLQLLLLQRLPPPHGRGHPASVAPVPPRTAESCAGSSGSARRAGRA